MSDQLNYCKKHHHSYVHECVDCYRESTECIHGVPFDSECSVCEEYKKIINSAKKPIFESMVKFGLEQSKIVEKLDNSTRPKVPHYQGHGIEPIDYINSHNFNFNRGCVIKYVSRAGLKDKSKEIEDLRKAIDYLNFEIERLQSE